MYNRYVWIPFWQPSEAKVVYGRAQATSIHLDRTAGGNRYYCAVDGDIDASAAAGAETGPDRLLPE